jgi:Zn-dependent M28 family amino/carboxypeptidase
MGDKEFNGERAMEDVRQQVAFGPRIMGSDAHTQTVTYISDVLEENDWRLEIQEATYSNTPIRNVVGKRGEGSPWIILGAHYDSRLIADRDPDPQKQNQPVPGANDGASGVAVLLELARVLPDDLDGAVWLVFFDAEDNGHIPGWDWIIGSTAFAQSLSGIPDAVIIVDMVGDADQNIYKERNSDPALTDELWQHAAELGYSDKFIPTEKHAMLDDHTPFLALGITAVDIIDFDYDYYHTTEDTPDKVSAESLKVVGDTLLRYLTQRNRK